MESGFLLYIVSHFGQVDQAYLGYSFDVRSSVVTNRGLRWCEVECRVCGEKNSVTFTNDIVIKDHRRRVAIVDCVGHTMDDGISTPSSMDLGSYDQITRWLNNREFPNCRQVLTPWVNRVMSGAHHTNLSSERIQSSAVRAMHVIGATTGRIRPRDLKVLGQAEEENRKIILEDVRMIRND